jgi:hypothetical protein
MMRLLFPKAPGFSFRDNLIAAFLGTSLDRVA